MMFITRNYLLSISAFFFVVGPMSFLLYQNAIYNKKPFSVLENPFNTKNNGVSLSNLVFGSLIFVSIGFVSLIGIFTNNIVASYFLLFVGIAFTITVPFWLRNIYKRFLQRKYENMEEFRGN